MVGFFGKKSAALCMVPQREVVGQHFFFIYFLVFLSVFSRVLVLVRSCTFSCTFVLVCNVLFEIQKRT
jgi:hypothetical protein